MDFELNRKVRGLEKTRWWTHYSLVSCNVSAIRYKQLCISFLRLIAIHFIQKVQPITSGRRGGRKREVFEILSFYYASDDDTHAHMPRPQQQSVREQDHGSRHVATAPPQKFRSLAPHFQSPERKKLRSSRARTWQIPPFPLLVRINFLSFSCFVLRRCERDKHHQQLLLYYRQSARPTVCWLLSMFFVYIFHISLSATVSRLRNNKFVNHIQEEEGTLFEHATWHWIGMKRFWR